MNLKERIKRLKEIVMSTTYSSDFSVIYNYIVDNKLTNTIVDKSKIEDEEIIEIFMRRRLKKVFIDTRNAVGYFVGNDYVVIYDANRGDTFYLSDNDISNILKLIR